MPVLANTRHEMFAHQIAKGMSQREAYKIAGYSVKTDATADANASRLLSDDRISSRVKELREAISTRSVEKTSVDKAWIIAKLVENVERAMQAEPVLDHEGKPTGEYKYNGNVANKALELLGKERGMFVDRKEVGKPGDFDAMSDSDLDAFIQQEARELLAQTKRSATKH